MPIFFHTEAPLEFELAESQQFASWVEMVVEKEEYALGNLNYIFCDDDYLLSVNREYLQHDYYTDIITFDLSEGVQEISGDIFVSIDRVRENADKLGVSFNDELRRVLAHGVLHLAGYNDKTEEETRLMRQKETESIQLYKSLNGN